jgi:hypothetical protein
VLTIDVFAVKLLGMGTIWEAKIFEANLSEEILS